MKDDPAHGRLIQSEGFAEVPSDRFSFAVLVCRYPYPFRFLDELLELGHHFLLLFVCFVGGGEPVFDIDPQVFLREVSDMSERGFDGEVLSEEFLDRLSLRRRLDNHKIFHRIEGLA